MSNSPSTPTRSVNRAYDSASTWAEGVQTLATTASAAVVELFRAASFWAAIVAPVCYPPLLYRGESSLILGLLVLHVVALLVGHGYEYDQS